MMNDNDGPGPGAVRDEVEALVQRLASLDITLDDLTPEQMDFLSRAHAFDTLKAELAQRVALAKIDMGKELEEWIASKANAGTREGYNAAFVHFKAWCDLTGTSPLTLTAAGADDFASSLRQGELSSSRVIFIIAAVSSWYSFLVRRHKGFRNPFIGTRARPKKRASKEVSYPALWEVSLIIKNIPKADGAAIAALAYRGIPVGALSELEIHDGKLKVVYRGATIEGPVPAALMEKIQDAGLPLPCPFAFRDARNWSWRIKRVTDALLEMRLISHAYSATDFRHFYTAQTFKKNKDLYRLRRLLGHSSVEVTQAYLKTLKLQ